MIEILSVDPGSIGAELDLEPGDCLLSINGEVVRDLLDFQLQLSEEELLLEVRKKEGELWDIELEKDAGAPMGLHFEHPEPKQCGNNCIFCFVHQLPSGMRSTLYVKDEDFRFSFLYGSYITLTNLDEADIQRIIDQHLSPLYVSVHATNDQLRSRLLGVEGPPILDLLRRLTAAGIEVHTQIVLCPGLNDGEELERTVEDLQALHPGVISLAVVPLGLTGYRQRLPTLESVSPEIARSVLEVLERYQEQLLDRCGTRFVFAADEFYLKAGIDFPPIEAYEDLGQLENGVGMVPLFRSDAAEALAEARSLESPEFSTITGESSLQELEKFCVALSKKTGVIIHLHPVRNEFFGGQVTVTGLLTGRDVAAQLRDKPLGEVLLVPDVMLKDGEDVFLDDLSLNDLEAELGVRVEKVESSPWGLLEALERHAR
ncbi:MAG: DUF512 domain-containing protein [Desulfuromonas sp.]|uniref:DUF512 domain-containing protein n=1 Tax=Desulfuromonas sp. TaxID=892 RepID=UPI000CA80BB9|nr:DUF512 domain-containing protein [Desulfuromonas sp.]PLX84718.1 MAG: DUF512 domain-containing protein [Desulfuromonas sp.]